MQLHFSQLGMKKEDGENKEMAVLTFWVKLQRSKKEANERDV